MASKTIVQSAALLQNGPSLSCSMEEISGPRLLQTTNQHKKMFQVDKHPTKLSDMLITPVRPTVPKVGRNAVTPQRAAG